MGTIGSVIYTAASLFTGTAGAYPSTLQGYSKEGFNLLYTPEVGFIRVHEETFAIGSVLLSEETIISSMLSEATLETLRLAMAGAAVTTPLTLGAGAMNTLSLRLVGTAPGSLVRETLILVACPNVPVDLLASRKEEMTVPCLWTAYKSDSNFTPVVEIADFSDETVASGVLAMSATNDARVAGQGAAPDTIDTITGLDNGDTITLRIYSESQAITVSDNDAPTTNQIDLTGSADFVMDSLLDRLTLTRTDGTIAEVSRIDFD